MRDFKAWIRRDVASLDLPPHREEKIIDELASQIEDVYSSILDEGMSPDDAWLELKARIPPVPELLEEIAGAEGSLVMGLRRRLARLGKHRDTWFTSGMGRVVDVILSVDLRTTVRRLVRSKAFAVSSIVTLAICLGANAAVFTIVDQVLLNPLPVPEPSRIMLVANQFPNANLGVIGETSSARNYYQRRQIMAAFSEQAMFRSADLFVGSDDGAARVRGMIATPSLFSLLQVNPALGRWFTQTEGEVGSDDRVILSHAAWRELYGADPSALGTTVRIDERQLTIVGVMPADFSFVDPEVRFWLPAALTTGEQNDSAQNNWRHVGRLASGATIEQAQAQARIADARFLESAPFLREIYSEAGYHSTVEPLEDALTRRTGAVLYLLWGGSIVLLLIGSVNIANLSLARSHLQARDLAVRMALGAGRAKLATFFLGEGLLISLVAGALGLLLAFFALQAAGLLAVNRLLTLAADLEIRLVVVGFVLGLSTTIGIVIGLVPLVKLKRQDLVPALVQGSRTGTSGRWASRLRRSLVTAQVSLTFVLLVAAGLLLLTLMNLLAVDPGFTGENIVTASVDIRQQQYEINTAAQELLDRSLEAVRALPGVGAAAATTVIPLSGEGEARAARPEGAPESDQSIVVPTWARISPGFFDTLDVPLIRGRDFEGRDEETLVRGSGGQGVVIVDEALARTFWPTEDAIGKRLFIPGIRNTAEVHPDTRWLTVIGIVPELKLLDLADADSIGTFYTLLGEANLGDYPSRYSFVIRTAAGDPLSVISSMRRALSEIEPQLALFDIQTLEQWSMQSLERERLAMWLSAVFGSMALLLSAVGVYGVLSYLVAQRMREFGIRVALGSTPNQVFRSVVRDGLLLAFAGLTIGLIGILALRPVLSAPAFGIQPSSPLLMLAMALILMVVVLLASAIPARRATQVDPIVVLGEQ